MKRLFTRCQEQVGISSAAPFPPVEECERSAVKMRGWGMDKGIIEAIALWTIRGLAEDSGYIPYLPDLRIRFSATSEEVLAGVELAQGELTRTNPYYQGDRPATGIIGAVLRQNEA